MRHTLRCGLAALSFTALVACGGSNDQMQPQTPSTTTTTASQQPVDTTPQFATSPPTGTRMEPPISNPGIAPAQSTTSVTTTGAPTALSAGSTDAPAMSDGQILAVLDAANTGEVDQARIAIKKAKSDQVKKFAEHMVTDHGQAESKLKTLSTRAGILQQQGADSRQLIDGSQQVLQLLTSETGTTFDQTYMDAQIAQHKKVLDLIDRMLPQAQSTDLKGQLQESRSKVADHLQRAQEIRASLGT